MTTKCEPFELPGFMGTWWKCCQCNTGNGDARSTCKHCQHQRCSSPATKTIPIEKEDGSVLLTTIKTPTTDTGKAN